MAPLNDHPSPNYPMYDVFPEEEEMQPPQADGPPEIEDDDDTRMIQIEVGARRAENGEPVIEMRPIPQLRVQIIEENYNGNFDDHSSIGSGISIHGSEIYISSESSVSTASSEDLRREADLRREEEERRQHLAEIRKKNKNISTGRMVKAAIADQISKGRNKVSYIAIKKFILKTYKDEERLKYLKRYILTAVERGELVRMTGKGLSGSFRFPRRKAKPKKNTSKNIAKGKKRSAKKSQKPKGGRAARKRKPVNKRKKIANGRKRKPKGPRGRGPIRFIPNAHSIPCAMSRLLFEAASNAILHSAPETVRRALSRALIATCSEENTN